MTSVHPPMRKGQGPPGPWREGLGTQPSAVPCQPGRSPSFGWATLGSPVSLPGSEAPPRVGTQPAGRAEVGVDCAAAVLCGPPGTPLPQPGCLHSPPTQQGWDLASLIKDIPNERRVWIALCLHCDGNCKQRGVPKGMPPGPLHRRVAHRPFPLSSRLLPAAVIQCGPCCHLARSPPRGAQRSGWKRKPHLRDRHPSPSPARPDKWTGTKAGMVKLRAVTFPVVPSPGDP